MNRSFFLSADLGIISQDKNGNLTAINPVAEEILGLDAEKHKTLEDIVRELKIVNKDGSIISPSEFPSNLVLKNGVSVKDEVIGVYKKQTNELVWFSCSAFVDTESGKVGHEEVYTIFHSLNSRNDSNVHKNFSETVLDDSAIGIFQFDENGRIMYANKYMCDMLGFSREEILQLNIDDIDPPQKLSGWQKRIKNINILMNRELESIHRKKNGVEFPVELTINKIQYDNKFHSVVFVKDISARMEAIEYLKKSKVNLETAQEKINLGSWELDLIDNSVYWSKEMYKLFYRDTVKATPDFTEFLSLIHPDDRSEIDELFKKSMIDGSPNNIQFRTNPDIGPVRYLSTQYSCVMENNNVVKISGTNLDISSRIKAESELQKKEKQLSLAAKVAKIGYWEYDVSSDMFTFNDNFYAIFRTTAEKVGGYKMSSSRYTELFVHPEDVMVVGNEIRKALKAEDENYTQRLEHRMIYSDGQSGFIEVRIFIIKDEKGNTIKSYGVNQDITERKNNS